jgi:anti-anti-sigma factor
MTSPTRVGHPDDSVPPIRHESRLVWLNGELDLFSVEDLADTLAQAIADGDGDVTVDLSGVTFLSAAAVHELVHASNVLQLRQHRLALRAPPNGVRLVLEACGLSRLVVLNLQQGGAGPDISPH